MHKFLINFFKTIFSFLILFSVVSCKESAQSNFVIRDGLIFKNESQTPFTGLMVDEGEKTLIKSEVTDGKKHGKNYFYQNDKLMIEGNYSFGKMNGRWIYFFENGNIETSGNFKDDFKDGIWIGYFPTGQKFWEVNYINDKPDGKYLEFFLDGRVKFEIQFEMGKEINRKEF